jgi:sugar lactone lactonase YvrE
MNDYGHTDPQRPNDEPQGYLLRIDEDGRIIERIDLPGSADGIAIADGSVWVTSADQLLRIAPSAIA